MPRRKPPQTRSLRKAREDHEAFLKSHGIRPSKRPKLRGVSVPESTAPRTDIGKLSNSIPANGPKRDKLMEHLWLRGAEESREAVAATYRKAALCAPSYNKGGAVYQGEEGLEDALKTNKRR